MKSINDATLSDLIFTAIDIETTGLDAKKSEILEIAAVQFNREKVLRTFNQLIKPEQAIPAEATKVNGIRIEDVALAPSLRPVMLQLLDFLNGTVLVAHNADFDIPFLIYHARVLGLPFPTLPVYCTLQLSRKYFPLATKHNLNYLREFFKIPHSKQRSLASANFHEALDDSHATMLVFLEVANQRQLWTSTTKNSVYHQKGYKTTEDYSKI
jgi:DNA polymerase III subunit alpha, Gram-positive type